MGWVGTQAEEQAVQFSELRQSFGMTQQGWEEAEHGWEEKQQPAGMCTGEPWKVYKQGMDILKRVWLHCREASANGRQRTISR